MSSDTLDTGIPESLDQNIPEEAPRMSLTLKQAAAILGKSPRAVERCILGRWGNKLPEGWTARKLEIGSSVQWRIIPPAGFVLQRAPELEIEDLETDYLSELAAQIKRSVEKIRLPNILDDQPKESATIVIDRSDEVELLLRELLQTQKQLSEERRMRMDDLRLLTQMQGSMKLLEDRAAETSTLKEALTATREEFQQLKDNYLQLLRRPWWKRLFQNNQL
jgi:hypothetical protein